jgi:hypothetical protein
MRELDLLLGFPFAGVRAEKRSGSLLATALCDLAAFGGDHQVYCDVVNELLAVQIAFQYYQPRDTLGQFVLDGDDVLQYPNVEYDEELSRFTDAKFANHIANEERTFKLVGSLGPQCYAALMLLLRDRYFPLLWPALVTAAHAGNP